MFSDSAAVKICQQEARTHEYERYLASLVLPVRQRPWCWSLLAYHHALARITNNPAEVMVAEIRLQWWIDALSSAAPSSTPEVQVLHQAIKQGVVSQATLLQLAEARRQTLVSGMPVDTAGSVAFCKATHGALAVCIASLCAVDDCVPTDSAEAAGIAFGMYKLTAASAYEALAGKMPISEWRHVYQPLQAAYRQYYQVAIPAARDMRRAYRPVWLPLVFAERHMQQLQTAPRVLTVSTAALFDFTKRLLW